jgi:ribulose-phosphate 3-epimerase
VKPSAHAASPIDVHLMVKPVDSLVPMFAKAGAHIITFHPEASAHRPPGPESRNPGKAGLVFNRLPAVSGSRDGQESTWMLIMSVNRNFGG